MARNKDGASHSVPDSEAHPHRGPAGIKDTMKTGHKHEHHKALEGPLPSFGMDEDYDGPGSAHHLGNNEC